MEGTVLRLLAHIVLAAGLLAPAAADALTGGTPAGGDTARHAAMIVSTRGAACTGIVLAPDLLLTAAHCVGPSSDYAAVVFEEAGPRLVPVEEVALHPRYSADAYRNRTPVPDIALVRLAGSLPAAFAPAQLSSDLVRPEAGDRYRLAGFGMTDPADPRSAGRLTVLDLPVVGNTIDATGIIMTRLSDGRSGACDGDSGGPVWAGGAIVAVIGWRRRDGDAACGTVTGATLVAPQLDWIRATAAALASGR